MNLEFDPNRICNSRSRTRGRYTKDELIELGKHLGFKFKRSDTLDKMCDELRRYTRQRNINYNANYIQRCHAELRPHQLKAIRYMENHNALFLFHKMGCGKTLTAIVISQQFLDRNPGRNVVVLCPSILIDNFKSEMENNYKKIKLRNHYKFYSIENPNISVRTLRDEIENGMLIVDEAHRLVNNTKMSKILTNSLHGVYSKVLLMSGTPLVSFDSYFSNVYPKLLNIDPPSVENMLCKVSYYSQPTNNSDFPIRKNHPIFIRMSPEYSRKYDTFLRKVHFPSTHYVPSRHQIEDQRLLPVIFNRVDNPRNLKKLSAFLSGVRRATQNLDNSENNYKLDWVSKFMLEHPNEKTIIFSSYLRDGINLIINKLPSGVSFGEITGKKTLKARKAMIDKYNRNEIKLLFLSSNAKEGISLKNTKNVIIFEPQWNDQTVEQMIARAIRFKSHHDLPENERVVHVYSLYHFRQDEIPSLSKKSLASFFKNIPEEISNHIIHPFLPIQNENVKDFKRFLKNVESIVKTKIETLDTMTDQEKTQFNDSLRKTNHSINLKHVSIDYYMYLNSMLKNIKLQYYEHVLKKFSIEKNDCA
jgi:superfamily II DNA or RNA helicase